MEKEAQKFLEAEEVAVKLVETLKQLHTEATSYQTATKELDTVRQQLLNLIDSTERMVGGSHEVIKILREIGTPEILNRLVKLEDKSTEEFAKQSKDTDKLNSLITLLEGKVTEEFAKQSKGIDKLNTLITVTLASSIIAIIIGIIALLR